MTDETFKTSAETARAKAASAAAAARDAAETKAQDMRDGVEAEADEQRTSAASAAHRVAGSLDDAARDMDGAGPAGPALRRASAAARRAGDIIDDATLGDAVDAIDGFARRNPAMFLGAAALAGFAVARFATARRPDEDDDLSEEEFDALLLDETPPEPPAPARFQTPAQPGTPSGGPTATPLTPPGGFADR